MLCIHGMFYHKEQHMFLLTLQHAPALELITSWIDLFPLNAPSSGPAEAGFR